MCRKTDKYSLTLSQYFCSFTPIYLQALRRRNTASSCITFHRPQDFEQLNLRLSLGLRDKLKEVAKQNKRSLNGHAEFVLEQSLINDENQVIKYLLCRIEQLEAELSATKV